MRSNWKPGIFALNFIKAFIAIFIVLQLSSCNSDLPDPTIDFVGDSIIARWDINQDFPSYYVYNYGVGGSGIELLKSYNAKFIGNDVVVISGTNDHLQLTPANRQEYALEYLKAIQAMTDRRIFIFSVLPRKFDGDRNDINNDIEAFNILIQELIKGNNRLTYIDVYHEFLKGNDIDMQYYSDGLHPNIIGYEILTQKLLKAL